MKTPNPNLVRSQARFAPHKISASALLVHDEFLITPVRALCSPRLVKFLNYYTLLFLIQREIPVWKGLGIY
jgi:hypothetical protein